MGLIISILQVAGPWALGTIMLTLLMPVQRHIMTKIGFGFYVGQLLQSIFIFLLDHQLIRLTHTHLLSFNLISLIAFIALLAKKPRRVRHRNNPALSFIGYIVGVLIIGIATSSLITNFESPVWGWDVLQSWAPQSYRFLENQRGNFSAPYYFWGHPVFVPNILTSGQIIQAVHNTSAGYGLAWWALHISFVPIAYGLSRDYNNSNQFSLLFACLVLSTPLPENHGIVIGYADLWVAVGLLLFIIALIDAANQRTSKTIIILAGSLTLVLILKANAFIYPLLILSGLCLQAALKQSWRFQLISISLMALAIPILAFMFNTQLKTDFVIRLDFPMIEVGSIGTRLGIFNVTEELTRTLVVHASYYIWVIGLVFISASHIKARVASGEELFQHNIELTALIWIIGPLILAAFTTEYLSFHTRDFTTMPRTLLYAYLASAPYFLSRTGLLLK